MVRTPEERRRVLVEMLGSGSASDMRSGTLVVVPSITFPEVELRKITGIQFYEERLLFLLLLLRHPDLSIVFVTSVRVEEPVVDYYLRFVPPEVRPGERLWLVALWNPQPRALAGKLLEDEAALGRLRELARGDACLLTFNVTHLEEELAARLDAPLYGCPVDVVSLGSKSGSRRVAREAGVPVLPGAEDLFSLHEVEKALNELRATSRARSAVVKLNDGFSGQGNAIVDLTSDRPVTERHTVFCASEESWSSFEAKLGEHGGVVEEHLKVPGMVSPSVQMRIAPDASVEVVSTHDQILGGPDGQVYLGCRFPAHERYREAIQDAGRRVARVLAEHGAMGSFGIDFVIPPGDPPQPFLTEINLRMGGTTHPFLMAEFATGGTYDESTGELVAGGAPKHYVATDNLKSDDYVGLAPETLIRTMDDAGLAFDMQTKTGVLLHLLGALKKHGKVGMTCVGDSAEEADLLYERAQEVLEGLAAGS